MDANEMTPEELMRTASSLRSILNHLIERMEKSGGQQFSDLDKAMISHGFYNGAQAVMALSSIEESEEPTPEEMKMRGALLGRFKNDLKEYHDWLIDMNKTAGEQTSFPG